MPLVSSVRSPSVSTAITRTFARLLKTLSIVLICFALSPPARAAELVIVVDDVGYHLDRARRLVNLPGAITLGMLPFAPHTPQIARQAVLKNKEVILHQPMEPMPPANLRTERGTLTLGMTAERFDHQFAAALANVPQAVGVNNHTGSLLTQHHEPMNQLMDNIQRRGLFFLDSRTTPRTVAETTARAWRIPTLRRDVFLDHDPNMAAIETSYREALRIARRQGHAVVIAHPYRSTLKFLERQLIDLPDDVRLITLGDLAQKQRRVRRLDRTTLARLESPESRNRSPGL